MDLDIHVVLISLSAWVLGWLMCKTVPYIQGVSVAASVYSLIAVSLDRWVHLNKLQLMKKKPIKPTEWQCL